MNGIKKKDGAGDKIGYTWDYFCRKTYRVQSTAREIDHPLPDMADRQQRPSRPPPPPPFLQQTHTHNLFCLSAITPFFVIPIFVQHPLLPRFKGEVLFAPAIKGNPPPSILVAFLRYFIVPLIPRWEIPSCLESGTTYVSVGRVAVSHVGAGVAAIRCSYFVPNGFQFLCTDSVTLCGMHYRIVIPVYLIFVYIGNISHSKYVVHRTVSTTSL